MSDNTDLRELDAKIAEKVFGFQWKKTPKDYDGLYGDEDILVPLDIDHDKWQYPPKGRLSPHFWVPKYSTDLREAWRVFEKFHSRYLFWNPDLVKGWECKLSNTRETAKAAGKPYVYAESAPVAICLAALFAIGNGQLSEKT